MQNQGSLNKTNQVVREATRIASRDVRAPKVVRQGKVFKTSNNSSKK